METTISLQEMEFEQGVSGAEIQTPLTPGLLRLMALGCGLSVANMYYCQPLLAQMRGAFHVTMPQVSSIPILTQVGGALACCCSCRLATLRSAAALS